MASSDMAIICGNFHPILVMKSDTVHRVFLTASLFFGISFRGISQWMRGTKFHSIPDWIEYIWCIDDKHCNAIGP